MRNLAARQIDCHMHVHVLYIAFIVGSRLLPSNAALTRVDYSAGAWQIFQPDQQLPKTHDMRIKCFLVELTGLVPERL